MNRWVNTRRERQQNVGFKKKKKRKQNRTEESDSIYSLLKRNRIYYLAHSDWKVT